MAGNPVSRQWPFERMRAGSFGWELGVRINEPEQLLSATVPAKSTALTVALAPLWVCGAATTGAAPAPTSRSASTVPTRGFFMWGFPSEGIQDGFS